jgi:hypothetical protein
MPFAGRLHLACGLCVLVGTLAACGDDAALAPEVHAIAPERTCDVTPGPTRVLRLSGKGLAPRVVDTLGGTTHLVLPTVKLQRVTDATGAAVSGEAPVAGISPRFLASGEIELTIPGGASLATGRYDVTVSDENGRAGTLAKALDVAPPPAPFYVDPQTVWAGAVFDLTGWLDRRGVSAGKVSLERHGDPASRRELTPVAAMDEASRFEVTLPADLAEGDYDVIVESEGGCVGTAASLLHVQEQLTPMPASFEPDTGVTSAAFPVAMVGAGIAATPRLFLRKAGERSATATPLVALDWQAATLVDAVVQPGLPAGLYDVIVLAADGTVGLLDSALTLIDSPALDVETVSPEVLPLMTATPLAIHGAGFDAPTVRLRCRKDGVGPPVAVQLQVTRANATDIVASAPASPNPAVCVVRVINGSGAVAQYSAVAYAGGPASVELGQLLQKRRAPGAAVVRIRDRHLLYVLGGDDGHAAGALDSVDSCKFDLFGRAAPCRPQRSHLTTARSFVGVTRVGRFVYAVGGENAKGVLRTIERARVLDPGDAPKMAAYDLELADGTHGLAGGQWIYRISAILDENDLDDPLGETLAAQPALVVVPARGERVKVHLSWAPVEHAGKYRVYRTPVGGTASGGELLVWESTGAVLSWIDEGQPATGEAPLKPFQLSDWHAIAPLAVARAGAAVVSAVDPASPEVSYLYVAGGRDESGAPRDDYEWFTLTDVGAGRQRVAGPFMGGSIGGARAQLPAWTVSAAQVPAVVSGDTWLYLGGGEGPGGVRVTTTVAGKVPPGGQVSFATTVNGTPVPGTGGGGAVVQRAGLVLLGGGGAPTRGGVSADVCTSGELAGGCTGAGVPALGNWSSVGGTLLARARYLMATVRSGPFVFIVGGQADGEAATASFEGGAW